jgi:hypothetical protein
MHTLMLEELFNVYILDDSVPNLFFFLLQKISMSAKMVLTTAILSWGIALTVPAHSRVNANQATLEMEEPALTSMNASLEPGPVLWD